MTAMKGATQALGSMNRTMNLPALQRIAMEFERENDVMEQRQEIMDDVMDDAMDVGAEEESEEVVEQVLEEIGVDLNSAVSISSQGLPGEIANVATARRDARGRAVKRGGGEASGPGDWGRRRFAQRRRRRRR